MSAPQRKKLPLADIALALEGKTVLSAEVVETKDVARFIVIHFTDGSTLFADDPAVHVQTVPVEA